MKRIAIYFYYDKNGVFDKYAFYYVSELKKVANRILIVVNGFLDNKSIELINDLTDELIIRENTGLDVFALREALFYIGWNNLSKYDEVIYCNSTVFGPVYPFEVMFNQMSLNKNLDFWGITSHPQCKIKSDENKVINDELEYANLCKMNPYGYLPKHIQYYFIVYRKKFVKTNDFQEYWKNMCNINSYVDSVSKFETVFTKYFEDKGYKWDTYVKYDAETEKTNYLLLNKPDIAVIKYKSPVIKRKIFYIDMKYCDHDINNNIKLLIEYIDKKKLFDKNLIFENIFRTNKKNNIK